MRKRRRYDNGDLEYLSLPRQSESDANSLNSNSTWDLSRYKEKGVKKPYAMEGNLGMGLMTGGGLAGFASLVVFPGIFASLSTAGIAGMSVLLIVSLVALIVGAAVWCGADRNRRSMFEKSNKKTSLEFLRDRYDGDGEDPYYGSW